MTQNLGVSLLMAIVHAGGVEGSVAAYRPAWLLVIVLNFHYALGTTGLRCVGPKGPPSLPQAAALRMTDKPSNRIDKP